MIPSVRPTFQTIVEQALVATGAATGWLLAREGDDVRVVAAAGLAAGRDLVGRVHAPRGAQGYALSSGQPAALMPQPDDRASAGAGGHPGVPTAILTAPCGRGQVVGLLELADKGGGRSFTGHDMATATLLAAVAGAALAEDGPTVDRRPPAPPELARGLEELAQADPERYARTARLVELLLVAGT